MCKLITDSQFDGEFCIYNLSLRTGMPVSATQGISCRLTTYGVLQQLKAKLQAVHMRDTDPYLEWHASRRVKSFLKWCGKC